MPEIDKIFDFASQVKASDVYLKVGKPPIMRISGTPTDVKSAPLKAEEVQKLIYAILNPDQIARFEKTGDLDLAYTVPSGTRFRLSIFHQRGCISLVARRVNAEIPDFKTLNLPPVLEKVASYHQGLVLVCGVTGSGKSTTLGAIVEYINSNRKCHIVTIEDPIEFMYQDKKSFINQREVGLDVESFKLALRYVVRQAPDVILVGEMRDAETFQTALTAAETGHLVFGTLHSSTVPQTFGRIYDIFPPEERESVRQSLMFNLKAVICQKLAKTIDGKGRVPVNEIMVMNPPMQKLVQQGQEKKISELIRTCEQDGMCDFNQSLLRLIKSNMVEEKVAIDMSNNPEQLKMNLKGIFLSESGLV